MYIEEFIPSQNKKYIISSKILPDVHFPFSTNNGTYIYSILLDEKRNIENQNDCCDLNISNFKEHFNIQNIFDTLTCVCGQKFQDKQKSRLPSYGWEEMVGIWSCHNNEFKTILSLTINTKNKIPFSDFYYFHNCRPTKIFYNEVPSNFTVNKILFCFFDSFFQNNNVFEYRSLEVKFMYDVVLRVGDVLFVGKKVMFRYGVGGGKIDGHMNQFFFDKLLEELDNNNTNIIVCGMKTSYIKTNFVNLEKLLAKK